MRHRYIVGWQNLYLNCDVINLELISEHQDQSPSRGFGFRLLNDANMRGQAGVVAGNRPQMQVMHARDAWNLAYGRADRFEIKTTRHALQEDVRRIAQQRPRSRQHPKADCDGDDRVDPVELCEIDRDGSANDAK